MAGPHSWRDVQARYSVAAQGEGEMEIDGTALKITCDPRRHDDFLVGCHHIKRADEWPIFPAHFFLPFADGGDAIPITAFVMDDRIFGETPGASCCIVSIGGGDIAGNGRGQFNRHDMPPLRLWSSAPVAWPRGWE